MKECFETLKSLKTKSEFLEKFYSASFVSASVLQLFYLQFLKHFHFLNSELFKKSIDFFQQFIISLFKFV